MKFLADAFRAEELEEMFDAFFFEGEGLADGFAHCFLFLAFAQLFLFPFVGFFELPGGILGFFLGGEGLFE